jgi:DNA-binding transcriptional MocR family regulator
MTDKLPDVWTSRDWPVLLEVARRIDSGERMPRVEDVAQATGLSTEAVEQAGRALERRGLVRTKGVDQRVVLRFHDLSGEAYLLTGLHPSGDDAVTTLVDALRQAADLTDDPVEKSRLRALADSALGVSRNVLAGVLTAYLTSQIPGAGG